MASLLAVDLGLKTGLALYGDDGRLKWYRSRHFGSPAQLRRRVEGLFGEWPEVTHLVLEGGGPIADIWQREADRRGVIVHRIAAEDWRRMLFFPRHHRNGTLAKRSADSLARKVITWSAARRPTSLRHDAAEAILVGLYGALTLGWLEQLPDQLRR